MNAFVRNDLKLSTQYTCTKVRSDAELSTQCTCTNVCIDVILSNSALAQMSAKPSTQSTETNVHNFIGLWFPRISAYVRDDVQLCFWCFGTKVCSDVKLSTQCIRTSVQNDENLQNALSAGPVVHEAANLLF